MVTAREGARVRFIQRTLRHDSTSPMGTDRHLAAGGTGGTGRALPSLAARTSPSPSTVKPTQPNRSCACHRIRDILSQKL
jgi:hypothetical protein